ncbi:SDR family NAD(P)-dependent oxidoreductase [Gorillibacterium massiliense]|uniref:SDR family NAD(P)-dependent oxidoreductase n=1 Tax=Gorillibacterium massiliense TaxID=1280390 RepID=UPI0004AC8288|nr:SDR family oxidoreductase [Gorillibacterium massiliense]
MVKRLDGKVAVITGASSGVGAIIARDLAEIGAIPVLAARSEAKLQKVAAAIKDEHACYVLDVRSDEQVREVMDAVRARYGKIDILINCAGFGVFEYTVNTSLHTFEDMMDVNYMGTVRCIKDVLPHMLEAGNGNIVNLASMAGKLGSAKSSGYAASKHAVLGFTNSLRQELAGTGVRLSAINPGPIDTPFFETADPTGGYVNSIKWMMLPPERVSAAVIKAIVKGKDETDMPRIAAFGIKLYQLFPRLADRYAARLFNKK